VVEFPDGVCNGLCFVDICGAEDCRSKEEPVAFSNDNDVEEETDTVEIDGSCVLEDMV